MRLATEIEDQDFDKFYDKKTTIKRVIRIDSINEISLDNIGCHWTSNMSYTHTGGGQNGFASGKLQVSFFTTRKNKSVHKEATDMSRAGYPHEKEVVLQQDSKLDIIYMVVCEVRADNTVDYTTRKLYIASGNAGNRIDRWVLSL